MTVPPELQQVWDEAVAANQRSSTAAGGSGLERDAAVAAWQAITRHEAFDSAPPPFRAVVFQVLGLALHLRAVAGGAPTDIDEAITAFETAVATVPPDSASARGLPRQPGVCPAHAAFHRARRPPTAMPRSPPSRRRSRARPVGLSEAAGLSRQPRRLLGAPLRLRRSAGGPRRGRSGPSRKRSS